MSHEIPPRTPLGLHPGIPAGIPFEALQAISPRMPPEILTMVPQGILLGISLKISLAEILPRNHPGILPKISLMIIHHFLRGFL